MTYGKLAKIKPIGLHIAKDQFHGSPERFTAFDQSSLRSLGFHFGDIEQAKYFAGDSGFIYEGDLAFQNLVDIGKQDWGWTCAAFIAFAFHLACLSGKIPTSADDFIPFLGLEPWSLTAIKRTRQITEYEQFHLVELFRSYGFDGVRYINNFEPPGMTGGIAYLVLSPIQIKLCEIRDAGAHNNKLKQIASQVDRQSYR